eukprot:CAMPEP_0172929996 /NCGR_PEP_ID=MMETSP1075-20121228/218766_1 /TAXON_ID=2916 /ORGANISM="Ceratium fusus, Strain PA161109" /LENGTH=457 /DNA_ID=CAMNT_0013791303 /DNA_START=231 /DNA_END=1602 /DNA_ORIENTATION=+
MNALCAKYGRLPLIGLGLLAQGLSAICFGLINTSLVALLLSRFTQGCGASACNLAMFALVTDLYEESLGFVSGLNELFIGFGFSAGPLVGAVLYGAGGFPMPFLVCGNLLIVLAAFTPLLRGQGSSQQSSAEAAESASEPATDETALQRLWSACTRQLLVPAGLLLMGTALWGVIDSGFYTVHAADDLHLPQSGIGINLAAASAAYALTGPLAGTAADSIGYGSTMILGGITSGLSLMLLGPVSPFSLYSSSDPDSGLQQQQQQQQQQQWYEFAVLVLLGCGQEQQQQQQQLQQWYEFAVLVLLGCGQAALLIPSLGAMKSSIPAGNVATTEACISLFNAFQQMGLVIGPLASSVLGSAFIFGDAAMAITFFAYVLVFSGQLRRTGRNNSGQKGESLLPTSPNSTILTPSLEHGLPRSIAVAVVYHRDLQAQHYELRGNACLFCCCGCDAAATASSH